MSKTKALVIYQFSNISELIKIRVETMFLSIEDNKKFKILTFFSHDFQVHNDCLVCEYSKVVIHELRYDLKIQILVFRILNFE